MSSLLPEKLSFYENARRNAFIDALNLKSAGVDLAGVFGTAFPKELLWAAGLVPINVFSIDDSNTAAAEKLWGANNCALLKASYGYAVTDKCPFMHFADILVTEPSCIAKLELLDKLAKTKKTYKLAAANDEQELVKVYHSFINFLEKEFHVSVTEAKLRLAIKQMNAVNKAMLKLINFYQANPHVLGCLDFYNIMYGSSFIFDLEERRRLLFNLLSSLKNKATKVSPPGLPCTVLIAGAPQAGLREKILKTLQEILNQTAVICFSHCEGECLKLADEKAEPYMALAQKYRQCQKFASTEMIAEKFNAVAIIEVVLKDCSENEANYLRAMNIPYLRLETDYAETDTAKITAELSEFVKGLL